MKRVRIFLSAAVLLLATAGFGQSEKTVSAIKAGTKLTDSDIGFLSMISNADLSANRGAATHFAMVNNVKYTAGQTLTGANAKSINITIAAWQKKYKAPEAPRAGGMCYYWYYYCNAYGYCYYYKYWYYC